MMTRNLTMVFGLLLASASAAYADTTLQELGKAYQKNYYVQKNLPANATPEQREKASRKVFSKANKMIAADNARKERDKLIAIDALQKAYIKKRRAAELAKKNGKGKNKKDRDLAGAKPSQQATPQNNINASRVNTTGKGKVESEGAKDVQFNGGAPAAANKPKVVNGIIQDR